MALAWPFKDPDEFLDYYVDWTKRMVPGDAIVASLWIMPTTPDTSLVHVTDSYSPSLTVIWLSGGTLGNVYFPVNRVTTAGGRIMDQTAKLKIKTK